MSVLRSDKLKDCPRTLRARFDHSSRTLSKPKEFVISFILIIFKAALNLPIPMISLSPRTVPAWAPNVYYPFGNYARISRGAYPRRCCIKGLVRPDSTASASLTTLNFHKIPLFLPLTPSALSPCRGLKSPVTLALAADACHKMHLRPNNY